jgi:hypothetical protein
MSRLHFSRSGGVKAIWTDALANFFARAFGPKFAAARRRASIINTVEEGPYAGQFYADMSYLADMTQDDRHRVCLFPPRPLESDVKDDEVAYVEFEFIAGEKAGTW